ncbi:hypothetical protein [Nocardiopsis sp. NRRL B-16309]|uniref:hypothetical protein n=1 Tax=Nocardiopsis sp. NRRL B-16309 TaxID=1519494 RepID=UPI0012E1F5DE|nr:hypothetical protein [Nocardiopsis sp. NRRL B-16309]
MSGTVLARATAGVASLVLAATLTSCSFSLGELEPVGGETSAPAEEAPAEETDTAEQDTETGTTEDAAEEPADTADSQNVLPMPASEALTWGSDNYWLSGTGDALYRLDWTPSSDMTLELTHSGSSNFIIVTYGADETRYASIVNEIGAYEGSVTLGDLPLLDGAEAVDYLHIQADGPWTIGR